MIQVGCGPQRKNRRFPLFALLFVPVLVGCTVPVGDITPTPTITSTPTPDCPPSNITLAETASLEIIPNNLIFLIDLKYVESFGLEYADGKSSSNVFEFLEDIFPSIVNPGDRYSLFRFGFRDYTRSRIDRYSSSLTHSPDLPSTPVPPGQFKPLATYTPDPNAGALQNQVSENQFEKDQIAYVATATQVALDYLCDNTEWNLNFSATEVAWEATKEAEVDKIRDEFVQGTSQFLETYSSEVELGQRVVYEGLEHITVDVKNQCGGYARCIVIIIDDLDDHRLEKPENIGEINLQGVEIISVMLNCVEIYQPDCEERQEYWIKAFGTYGAKSVIFINGEKLEGFIRDYIGNQDISIYSYSFIDLGSGGN